MAETERKIYFYELRDMDTDAPLDGRFGASVSRALGRLDMPNGEHYVDAGNGMDLAAILYNNRRTHGMSLGYRRRTDLPTKESQGQVAGLGLRNDEGVYTASHMAFFDHGIVGAEFNGSAPRMNRLAGYLREVAPDLPHFRTLMLMRTDPTAQFNRMATVTKIEYQISKPSLEVLEQEARANLPFLTHARTLVEETETDNAHITIGHQPYQKDTLSDRLVNSIRTAVTAPWFHGAFRTFKLTGIDRESGESVVFDFLRDELVSHATVAKLDDESRSVEPFAMLREIQTAHDGLLPDISRAARVSV